MADRVACVYLRDIAQITSIISTAMMFLTPIFFPVESIPLKFQPILNLNPLAPIVHEIRNVLMFGRGIDPAVYAMVLAVSLAVMCLGFAFFQKVRRGFADVL